MTIMLLDRPLIEIETETDGQGAEVQSETGTGIEGIGNVSRTETGTIEIESGIEVGTEVDKIPIVARNAEVRDKVHIHFLTAL